MEKNNRKKSNNVDDYIVNADHDEINSRFKKPFLIIFTVAGVSALVAVGAFTGFFSKKEPTPYSEASSYESVDSDADDLSGSGNGKSKDKSKDKTKNKSDKEVVDPKTTYPRYIDSPSSEILNADPLSGMVQIGDYLFTLPCPLYTFMDAGMYIAAFSKNINDRITNVAVLDDNMTFSANTSHNVVIQYDDNSYYILTIFDSEEMPVLESTVVEIYQDEESDWYDNYAKPLYMPRGIHCGSSLEEVETAYLNDPLCIFSDVTGLFTYNGPERFLFNENNLVRMWYDKKAAEVSWVKMLKTR